MLTPRCTVPLLLALALASACDSATKEDKPAAPAKAPAAGDAKAEPHAATPHGGPGPAAMPHGGAPMAAANPHGGGMPPMMGAPAAPAGPPRDITPSGETTTETLPGLTFAVPKEWEKGTPTNGMRLAQFVLPGPGGDGELVVFRFPGGAGTIEANLTRWKGQFQPPEGKTIDDVTTTTKVEGQGVTTTLVDVSGTYVAAMSPGSPDKRSDDDSRMLAAIVEGSGDSFYFKAVGPKATLDLWAAPYSTMVGSFAAGSAPAADPAGTADPAPAAEAAEAKADGG